MPGVSPIPPSTPGDHPVATGFSSEAAGPAG